MINTRAAGDARHARTGKDGVFYNSEGVMLATVESFSSNVSFNNASYAVLGNAQELETAKYHLHFHSLLLRTTSLELNYLMQWKTRQCLHGLFRELLWEEMVLNRELYIVNVFHRDRLIYRI